MFTFSGLFSKDKRSSSFSLIITIFIINQQIKVQLRGFHYSFICFNCINRSSNLDHKSYPQKHHREDSCICFIIDFNNIGINAEDGSDNKGIDQINNVPASFPEFSSLNDDTDEDFKEKACSNGTFKETDPRVMIHFLIMTKKSDKFVAHKDKDEEKLERDEVKITPSSGQETENVGYVHWD